MPRAVATAAAPRLPAPLTLAVLVAVLLLLASCGGGGAGEGARPTLSATRTTTRSPSAPATSAPATSAPATSAPETSAASPAPPTSARPSATRSLDRSERPSPSPTSESAGGAQPSESATQTAQAEPTPTTSPSPQPTESAANDDAGTPSWVWWLLAAAVVGAAVGIPLLLRSRRRNAWRLQLDDAEAELGWCARELLPELRRVGSREQVAGGWAVGSVRVADAEDRLTALESSAPDIEGRDRARALRDSSRVAREGMQRLVAGGPPDTWQAELDVIVAGLEATLPQQRTAP